MSQSGQEPTGEFRQKVLGMRPKMCERCHSGSHTTVKCKKTQRADPDGDPLFGPPGLDLSLTKQRLSRDNDILNLEPDSIEEQRRKNAERWEREEKKAHEKEKRRRQKQIDVQKSIETEIEESMSSPLGMIESPASPRSKHPSRAEGFEFNQWAKPETESDTEEGDGTKSPRMTDRKQVRFSKSAKGKSKA